MAAGDTVASGWSWAKMVGIYRGYASGKSLIDKSTQEELSKS